MMLKEPRRKTSALQHLAANQELGRRALNCASTSPRLAGDSLIASRVVFGANVSMLTSRPLPLLTVFICSIYFNTKREDSLRMDMHYQ